MARLFCRRHFSATARSLSQRSKGGRRLMVDDLLEIKSVEGTSDAPKAVALSEERLAEEGLRYVPFRRWVDERRAEAKRSLFVQVKSKDSARDLLDYCQERIGPVKGLHFHLNPKSSTFSNFFLVEFDSAATVKNAILDRIQHFKKPGGGANGSAATPISSPFVWFSGKNGDSDGARESSSDDMSEVPVFIPTLYRDNLYSADKLDERVSCFRSLDEQMKELYRSLRIASDGTRVRFLACEQVEMALSGMFPHAEVLPFGSSVNSFGKFDCDLDMAVHLGVRPTENPTSRLLFHAKATAQGGQRLQSQRYCDQISNIIHNFLPGCQDVLNILHARVPIIKYDQQLIGLECDLSLSMSGFYMSELLYLYGELDERVRPLVFVIRKWAREQGLTQDERPTPYFTNFTLTIMTIFFLQIRYKMLPAFRDLQKLAGAEDRLHVEDGIDCTFIRDISGLQPTLNEQWYSQPHLKLKRVEETASDTGHASLSLVQMLTDFFDFYSHFDYDRDAICIVSGELQPKRNFSTSQKVAQKNVSFFLDVSNPLEPDLNVSANVQAHAVAKFRRKCEESLKRMWELGEAKPDSPSEKFKSKLFYLLNGEGMPKLNLKVESLGNWASEKKNTEPPKETEKSSEMNERRRKDMLKRKYLRVPLVREFFKPKL